MSRKRPKVFLDANVVIQAGKPPGGPIMSRIEDLVKADLISILTTDLTVIEVAKKHSENDYELIKEIGRPHFRKVVSEHLGVSIPDINRADLKSSISKSYTKAVTALFKRLKAKTLAIDDVKPSVVFTAYAEESGFFSGDGKKHQFPDAFIFECLKAEASPKSPVIIVTSDGDFDVPVKNHKNISLLKTIPELFQRLGLQVDAPEIEFFLRGKEDDLRELFDKELNDWGLLVNDVEDAEIDEICVTNVELAELISFGSINKGGSILVVGSATITAAISFTHPNWDEAMYDSEDKVLIPFEDVSGETEVTFDADFSMLILVDDNKKPTDIQQVKFRNSDFQYVMIQSHDDY